jgi:hypothetical protein
MKRNLSRITRFTPRLYKAHYLLRRERERERDLEMFNAFYKTFMVSFKRAEAAVLLRGGQRERTSFLRFSFVVCRRVLYSINHAFVVDDDDGVFLSRFPSFSSSSSSSIY